MKGNASGPDGTMAMLVKTAYLTTFFFGIAGKCLDFCHR